MSNYYDETAFGNYPEASKPDIPSKAAPLVRVIEKYTRSLPLKKINASDRVLNAEDLALLEDESADAEFLGLLAEVVDEVTYQIVGKTAEKILEDEIRAGVEIDDTTPPAADPEVEDLIAAVIDEDGEYVKEPDNFDIDIEAGATFAMVPENNNAKANEDNMKDELKPTATQHMAQKTSGQPMTSYSMVSVPGSDRLVPVPDPLQFLKSVEGRVLTVLEAALPDKEHRNAVKTLIKKEFRREMNRVGRTTQVSDEEEL